jgi:hypothetical protein
MTKTRQGMALLVAAVVLATTPAAGWTQNAEKPNILVIWGDDIGQSNISAYTMGLVGYGRRTSTGSPKRG